MTPLLDSRTSRRDLLRRGALVLCSAVLPSMRLRPQAVGPVMAALSSYMAAAKDRRLPPEVLEKAKHHILDTFAAMVSGSELPPGQAALTLARAQAGRPVATVVGSSVVTGPMDAALVNGVLAHSDETDDSHGPSQSHLGASIDHAQRRDGDLRSGGRGAGDCAQPYAASRGCRQGQGPDRTGVERCHRAKADRHTARDRNCQGHPDASAVAAEAVIG
jgi:hypothetical protein